jgi:ribosomal protein S18 acetylase RimI-like enzyme
MEVTVTNNKKELLSFLKKNPGIYFYLIGDLDDFFWPYTKWYCLKENNEIRSLALLYSGVEPPTLLLFHEGDPDLATELLQTIRNGLPRKFFAHLGKGLMEQFSNNEIVEIYGIHHKMLLTGKIPEMDGHPIRRLSTADLHDIKSLYSVAYPENWFDDRMIETGKYFGYFYGEELAGVAGIHVFSSEYRVAALGNIATHPDYRGRQIACKLTSRLCIDLEKDTDYIGLNVKADNEFAVKCYLKIGFEITGSYDECLISR